MKKLSLVLLLGLCAGCLVFGQASPAKRRLFTEALGMVGKRPPSDWVKYNGSYWKSRDISYGKEYMLVNVNGRNVVEQAHVGCFFANTRAQTRWLKESYSTLVADRWELILDEDDGTWVFMKGDILATGVAEKADGTPVAAVVFTRRN
jgi:hypothetical protein